MTLVPFRKYKWEVAKTGAAHCHFCERQIMKGEKKLAIDESAYPYAKKYSECESCGKNSLTSHINILTKLLDGNNIEEV